MMKKKLSLGQGIYLSKKIYIFLVLFSSLIFSQNLPTFTLNVIPVPETCTSNGALNFSVNGNDATASMTYYVYKAPNYSTAISTTTSNSVNGLTNGNYRILANQTKTGFQSNSQIWNGVIANNVKNLSYSTTTTTEICGNDASITINITSGNIATSNAYILYNSSGTTVIAGPQNSNVFLGLSGGTYLLSVKDNCGQTITQTVTITSLTPNINFSLSQNIESTNTTNCKTSLYFDINSGNTTSIVNYPIQIQVTTYDNGGNQIDQINETKTGTDFTSASTSRRYQYDIPYLVNTSYQTIIKITDACGNIFTKAHVHNPLKPNLSIRKLTTCGGSYFTITSGNFNNTINYTIVGSGAASGFGIQTFPNTANNPYNYDIQVGNETSPLPDGVYTITATDQCGHTVTTNYTLITTISSVNSSDNGPGCSVGMVNIAVNAPSGMIFTAAKLTSFPLNYIGPTTAIIGSTSVSEPFNVKANGTRVIMNNVPPGTYTFSITDNCGKVHNYTMTANNILTHGNVDIEQIRNCGSFDINMNVIGSNSSGDRYYLQIYNSSNNTWVNIQELINNSINGSFTQEGQYRVRKVYSTKGTNSTNPDNNNWWYDGRSCEDIIKTFTYSFNQLKFEYAYALACSSGTNLSLYTSATSGVEPYTFQIIEKSGDPSFTPINPISSTANDAIFTSLPVGVYKIRVTDTCLNTKDNWVDLSILPRPQIESSKICDGQNGSLSVQANSYLNYSWTKDNDPTVLSTTSVLNFTPFDLSTDVGTYFLHLTSNVAGSCIDETLSFVISSNLNNPNAGPDSNRIVCDNLISINLNSLLDSNADSNGNWEEITTSNGGLVGSSWSPISAGAGTYQFRYTAKGLCTGEDTAVYTVTVDSCGVCYKDANTSSAGKESKFGITLLQRAGANNGNWPMIRNSAHVVLESNSKGFVITRIATSELNNITSPTEGMMIYDTTEKCLKIYNGTNWSCFNKPGCP